VSENVPLQPALAAGTLPRLALPAADIAPIAAVVAVGGIIALLCRDMPTKLPVWAPYEFSWSEFLATGLAIVWYILGVRRMAVAERPALARHLAFATGTGLIYAVLQTHFEYMAQHMFFLNRLQHLVMHHLGPFLIALSWPGGAICLGMPAALRRQLAHPALRRAVYVAQHPIIAGVLFVGIIDLWLIPSVNFRAMIDHRLYALMNWSMVIDGIFFWCLILDPRDCPPARSSVPVRLATAIVVMFPQISLGSYLTFSTRDLYTFYDLCGRLYPSLSAIADQHIGGLFVWIPASMMSSAAFLLTLNFLRLREDARPLEDMTEEERRMTELARRWTGR
jgi:putative membrane protein